MEETKALFGGDDVDVFLVQLLKLPISALMLGDVVPCESQSCSAHRRCARAI